MRADWLLGGCRIGVGILLRQLLLRFGFRLSLRAGGGRRPLSGDASQRITRTDLLRGGHGGRRLWTRDRRINRHWRQGLLLRFGAAQGGHRDQTTDGDLLCRAVL